MSDTATDLRPEIHNDKKRTWWIIWLPLVLTVPAIYVLDNSVNNTTLAILGMVLVPLGVSCAFMTAARYRDYRAAESSSTTSPKGYPTSIVIEVIGLLLILLGAIGATGTRDLFDPSEDSSISSPTFPSFIPTQPPIIFTTQPTSTLEDLATTSEESSATTEPPTTTTSSPTTVRTTPPTTLPVEPPTPVEPVQPPPPVNQDPQEQPIIGHPPELIGEPVAPPD